VTPRALCGLLCIWVAVAALWLVSAAALQLDTVQRIGQASYLVSPDNLPPAPSADWQPVSVPVLRQPGAPAAPQATWFRMHFELRGEPTAFWGVLLPYFYGGGQIWLDGQQLADIPSTTERLHVRWERPHLVAMPHYLLHAGANALWVHAMPVAGEQTLTFPEPLVGPMGELLPVYDRRMFWVHTVPQLTVAACLSVSAFVLLIWSRLPEEVLYGWFGLATLLWGIRTLTFVMEAVPSERWPLWRLVYLSTTGGFIVVMLIFASRLAGLRSRWVEHALLAYWLTGPLWFAWQGVGSDELVNRLWTAGLIPIAISTVAISFLTVWRLRTFGSLLLPTALALATLCGVHDYLIVWKPEWLERVAPVWVGQRYFLLHHGANILLVAMGLLLATRFIRTVRLLRELNQTLESRVADREQTLAENYGRLAYLERQNAAAEERKLIMREIHDGLGSKLFTSLSRVERGAMDNTQMAASLRACISDMRLALDALAPDDPDLLITFGDFMFRWQSELDAVDVRCVWDIDVARDELALPPHATLQVLRVAQEALTNVAKHSCATRVDLSLRYLDGNLVLAICDNGIGIAAVHPSAGRGMHNMRARTAQLGGTLLVDQANGQGTRIVLTLACPIPDARR
jgi:signal transduction histidine kinase